VTVIHPYFYSRERTADTSAVFDCIDEGQRTKSGVTRPR